jgi:hypothetical protein
MARRPRSDRRWRWALLGVCRVRYMQACGRFGHVLHKQRPHGVPGCNIWCHLPGRVQHQRICGRVWNHRAEQHALSRSTRWLPSVANDPRGHHLLLLPLRELGGVPAGKAVVRESGARLRHLPPTLPSPRFTRPQRACVGDDPSAAACQRPRCARPWHARRLPGPYATGGPVAGPLSLIAGNRARTLGARFYAAEESSPPARAPSLQLSDE